MIKLPKIKGLMTLSKAAVAAHRPEILFGTSIVTTLSAVIMAGVGGYKSGQQVVEAELSRAKEDLKPEQLAAYINARSAEKNKLDVKEKIQLTWLNYLPSAGLTAGALGATTGLHIVHVREKKALAAAALMAIEEVREQSQGYINDIAKAVDDNVDEDTREKIDRSTAENFSARQVDADQLYLVRDEQTGRTFHLTENRVQNAVNEVNSMLNTRDVDLNTFYVWAGIPEIQDGELYGWNNRDFITVKWEDDHLADGRPVRGFSFRPKPKQGYDKGDGAHGI